MEAMNRHSLKMKVKIAVVAALVFLAGVAPVRADSLECKSLGSLFLVYLQYHLISHELNAEIKGATVDEFLKAVDPAKALLLESEAEAMRKSLLEVFDTSPIGVCSAIDKSYALIVQRVEEDEKFAKAELAKPDFKLDESVELVLDADARGRAKTMPERQALLGKLLQFQLANLTLTDMKLEEAKKSLAHRYEIVTKRVKERLEKGELVTMFAKCFASGLDPHSAYLSKEDLEDFQISMRLSLEGIGVMLGQDDGFPTVEEVVVGGAMDKLNVLKPKDKITAVAQQGEKPVSVIDMDIRSVVKLIRGKKGTPVTLTILRQGAKTETFTVTCIRDKIEVKESAASVTYETKQVGTKSFKIAIVDLPTFYGSSDPTSRSSSNDVRRCLEEAKKAGAQGIVLNLSRNGGGLLEEAVRIAGLFIKTGSVVATEQADGSRKVLDDTEADVVWNGPLLLLTTRMSASASEILAGALKDYHRAIVAGADHTFGKGTVQVLSPLSEGMGAIKVTRGMFFLPGGNSTQHIGVPSDIEVPSVFNGEEVGEAKMTRSLKPRTTPKFLSDDVYGNEPANTWQSVTQQTIRKLAELSKARVEKSTEFAKTKKDLEEAKRKGPLKLSEMLKKAHKDDDKKKTNKEKIKDLERPFLQESVSIMADWLAMLQS